MCRPRTRACSLGLLLWLALAPLLPERVGAQSDARLLELALGQSSTLNMTGLTSFSSSGPGVVEVTPLPDGSGLLVQAIAPGETALLLIGRDGASVSYRIRVTGSRGPRRIPAAGDVTLAVGEERTLDASNVASYSVAPLGVVEVRVIPEAGTLALTGRSVGVASVVLVFEDRHTETRRIEVTQASPTPDTPTPETPTHGPRRAAPPGRTR